MNLSEFIDHTNLSKTATAEDIIKLCEDAKKYHFPTVCVSPYYVKAASEYFTPGGQPPGVNGDTARPQHGIIRLSITVCQRSRYELLQKKRSDGSDRQIGHRNRPVQR